MSAAQRTVLAIALLLGLGGLARAADTIPHNETTSTTLPAVGCMFFDQGSSGGADTKLCATTPAGWLTAWGFGLSGNALNLVTQGTGSKISGHQLVYDASGNAVDGGAPGSGGTVTSLTFTAPLTGGTITTTGTVGLSGPSNLTTLTANAFPKGAGSSPFVPSMMSETGSSVILNYNTSSAPAAVSATVLQLSAMDGTAPVLEVDAFGAATGFVGRRADGTNASKTTVQSGDVLASFAAYAWDGSTYGTANVPNVSLREVAAQNQTPSAHGAYAELLTTTNGATTSHQAMKWDHDGTVTIPAISGSTQCIHASSTGVLSGTGSDCGSGGGTQINFTGVVSGGPTTYTAVSSGFTANAGSTFCSAGPWPLANGATPTLNVQSTGAKPIKLLTATGLISLTNSEISLSGAACFILDASATNWVLQTTAAAAVPIGVTDTVSAVKWASGQSYHILTAGQTITLPSAATSPQGGGIFVQTVGVTAQLCATGSDVINSGQVGAGPAGGCITLPADLQLSQVVTSGTAGATAFTVPLGPVQYKDVTWAEGLNLSTSPRYAGHLATPRVLYDIKCTIITAAGSAGAFHFWSTADGTAPASGTPLDTSTAINPNVASNTAQSATLLNTVILANYNLWITSTSTGTTGNGGCTFGYR